MTPSWQLYGCHNKVARENLIRFLNRFEYTYKLVEGEDNLISIPQRNVGVVFAYLEGFRDGSEIVRIQC